jgi:hypothetical protein
MGSPSIADQGHAWSPAGDYGWSVGKLAERAANFCEACVKRGSGLSLGADVDHP